ncbi:MAG: type II toxin-antitoxin system VapC family toxin [Planctomycetaceae bacterium]|nr:type II toxin-antitoxin system VapC family toxin [Planctomycetaceae bacterium]
MKEAREGFVLDCSVTMAWCFDDEATAYSDSVLESLAGSRAVVPSLWPLEVTNATFAGERRKRLDEARSQRFLILLQALPIIVDDETSSRAFSNIIHLARAYQLSTYDAAYLDTAIRRGLPLATLDAALKQAAQAVGVPLYAPST